MLNGGDETRFDFVRCDRATGKKTVVREWGQVQGRWMAEQALTRLRSANRDPSVEIEIREVGKEKEFRATAFGEPEDHFSTFPEEDT